MVETISSKNIACEELRRHPGALQEVRDNIRLVVTRYGLPVMTIEPSQEIDEPPLAQEISTTQFINSLGARIRDARQGERFLLTNRGKIFAVVETLQGDLFPSAAGY